MSRKEVNRMSILSNLYEEKVTITLTKKQLATLLDNLETAIDVARDFEEYDKDKTVLPELKDLYRDLNRQAKK